MQDTTRPAASQYLLRVVQNQRDWERGLELATWARKVGPTTWEIARLWDCEEHRLTDAVLEIDFTHGEPQFIVREHGQIIALSNSSERALRNYDTLKRLDELAG